MRPRSGQCLRLEILRHSSSRSLTSFRAHQPTSTATQPLPSSQRETALSRRYTTRSASTDQLRIARHSLPCRRITNRTPSSLTARLASSTPRSACHRHSARRLDHHLNLRSSFISVGFAAALLSAVALASWAFYGLQPTRDREDEALFGVASEFADMSYDTEPLPGRVGNLTPAQEEKLRKLWRAVFAVYGLVSSNDGNPVAAAKSPERQPTDDIDTQKKKRFNMFRKKGSEKPSVAVEVSDDDKYSQGKHFQELLANNSPETLREAIWTMVKHDHPDALALRFLRARKWDVDKALIMMISTMIWRLHEMKVDVDVMKNGEGGAVTNEKGAATDAKTVIGRDFMSQIRMGKAFLHGVDKQGRPICVVRVRLHKQADQCEEALQQNVVYIIETARMMLTPFVDTATIVFDMTGFSMANMDYNGVKFVIKCFEANFPESLGAVLVHNAPWIFQGIWKVIRGWLDPVVASKVHFTNSKSELEEFIEPGRIIKELGGEEDWEYKYIEPILGENDKMNDVETRDRLLKARDGLVKEFESATLQWIQTSDPETKRKIEAQRAGLADKLREDYWRLDPYLRARSLYDRLGVLRGGAAANWYPTAAETSAAMDQMAAQATSINDVD